MSRQTLTAILPQKAEAVLLTSPHNLRYFTGFSGGEGVALLCEDGGYLFVDSRYTTQALEETTDVTVIEIHAKNREEILQKHLSPLKSIGYEEGQLTVGAFDGFLKFAPKSDWIKLSQDLEELRMVKTEEELNCLRRAEAIGAEAFLAVLPQIKIGVTENEIAAEIEYQMRKRGSSGTSFETIVVSGYKSSMPHGKPDYKKIENGDFVTMDFGCVYQGYCSDKTRTVAVGSITKEQETIYQTVKEAQVQGLSTIRAGVLGKEADFAARKVIEDAGYGAYFGHSLGHGVGLLIHELPNLSPRSETVLKPNMVVTCEPGIYIPKLGGVRIEDMVCVTEDGIENLTQVPKDLLIL